MVNKIVRWIFALLGGVSGVLLFYNGARFYEGITENFWHMVLGYSVSLFAGGLIFFLVSPLIIKFGRWVANWIERELSKVPTSDIIFGSIGLVVGLIIAYIISRLLMNIPLPFIGTILSILVAIFLGYLGVSLATKRGQDLSILNSFADIAVE